MSLASAVSLQHPVEFASTEAELLLGCARWVLGIVSPLDLAPSVGRSVDWPRFLELADTHGLTPIAADALARTPGVPASVADHLAINLRENARRVFVMTHELVRVVSAFDDARISVAVLKGPVAAHRYYAEPAHREMGDLDLVVDPVSVPQATRTLEGLGYREDGDEHLHACRRYFQRWGNETLFRHSTRGIHIDLHWGISQPGRSQVLDRDELLVRRPDFPLEGHLIRTPSPVEDLRYFCAHASKHAWSSLSWVMDICGLIQRAGMPQVVAPTRYTMETETWIGLLLADFLFPGSVSWLADVCGNAPPAASRRAGFVVRSFETSAAVEETVPARLRLALESGLPTVLREIFVPAESDWASLRIPWRAGFFLYYPWRLARLSWKWRRGVFLPGDAD